MFIWKVSDKYYLSQNYPNPFNPETIIELSLPVKSKINLTIYNILGQKVETLIDDIKPAGSHRISWDGTDNRKLKVASGIYFYKLTSEDNFISKKMLFLK